MDRYFFSATDENGENADAFIDAETLAEAQSLYKSWCYDVMGGEIAPKHIWLLPKVSTEPRALNWYGQLERKGGLAQV